MQTNLHPDINPLFIEYLLSADYSYEKTGIYSGKFTRENVDIIFSHCFIEVQHFDENPAFPGQYVIRAHSFSGIDKLDFLGWVMLLDLTGAVSLRELICSVSKPEISSLLYQLFRRNRVKPAPLSDQEAPTLTLNTPDSEKSI